MKLSYLLLLPVLCFGCTSIANHRVTVVDEQGHPISGAGFGAPYPMTLRGLIPRDGPGINVTDARGRVELYGTDGPMYTLMARGYVTRSVPFPRDNRQTYVL